MFREAVGVNERIIVRQPWEQVRVGCICVASEQQYRIGLRALLGVNRKG